MNLKDFSDDELNAAYRQILLAKPQLPHYRRARLVIWDLLEERGRQQDAIVAQIRAARANPIQGGS